VCVFSGIFVDFCVFVASGSAATADGDPEEEPEKSLLKRHKNKRRDILIPNQHIPRPLHIINIIPIILFSFKILKEPQVLDNRTYQVLHNLSRRVLIPSIHNEKRYNRHVNELSCKNRNHYRTLLLCHRFIPCEVAQPIERDVHEVVHYLDDKRSEEGHDNWHIGIQQVLLADLFDSVLV